MLFFLIFLTVKQRPSLFRRLVGVVKTQGGDTPALENGEQPKPDETDKKGSTPPTSAEKEKEQQKAQRERRPGMVSALPRIDSSGSEGLNADGHSRRTSPQTT